MYIILKRRWCDIIVLSVHASTEDKIDDMKDRYCEQLEREFDKFHKYYVKNLLGDFNAKHVGKTFSNQQSEMKVCTKLVVIIELA
jgi:hypothetical protein